MRACIQEFPRFTVSSRATPVAGVGSCRSIPTTLANLVEYYGVRGLERRRVLGRVGEKKKKLERLQEDICSQVHLGYSNGCERRWPNE